MKKVKQSLAILLIISMIVTIAPEWASAAVTVSTESFIAMTAGQELHHTAAGKLYYVFRPEESGWYQLRMEDVSGCRFAAGVYENIYYTLNNEEQVEHTKKYTSLCQTGVSLSDHIMWLNQEEAYVFYCTPTYYEDPDVIDVALTIDQVEISGMEVVTPPSEPSVKAFIGTGMQVKIQYADSEEHYTVSGVSCSYNVYSDGTGYSTNCLNALEWNTIAYRTSNSYITNTIQICSLDGEQNTDIAGLENGEHTAELGIFYNEGGTSSVYKFATTFEKSEDNIESITVIQKTDTYTQWFGQDLENATIKVTYNDGTPDATLYVYNNGGAAYQYLSYDMEGQDGEVYQMPTSSIDTYLQNGGTLGEAEVTVKYQGKTITYPITIEENPYNGISGVTPARTVYYANAGYKDEKYNYSGDSISEYNIGRITLTKKDGAEPVEFENILNLPGGKYYLKYGLKKENTLYTNIDAYIKAGGTIGEQQLAVSYLDFEASSTIEIRENPYERIEVVTEPTKKNYTYSSYGTKIDFSGLVFRAYKTDGTYDTYTYGESVNPTGIEGWTRFFHSYYENKTVYLSEGTYTIDLIFMNMKMEYQIEVAKTPEEKYSDFKIIKNPDRSVYFTGEQETAVNSCLSEEGLEIEAVNSEGITKKYRMWYYPSEEDGTSDEYSSWGEIYRYISIDWSQIDLSVPGTYPVTVFCQEMTDTFEVTVADSPIVSFEILDMPDKDIFYRYEGISVDLRGMSYKITFDDGSVFAETLTVNDPDMRFSYQGKLYRIKKKWIKTNSSGYPTYGENAVQFSVFGHVYQTDTIQIKENPVESLEFVKNPDKVLYVGADSSVDLYGAVIRITYTDATTQEIEVEEHTSSIPIDRYGKSLIGEVHYMGMIGNDYHKCLSIVYMNQSAYLNVEISPAEQEAEVITDGGQLMIELSDTKPYHIIKFTPEEANYYYLHCVDYEDTDDAGSPQYFLELYKENQLLYSCSMSSGFNSFYPMWEKLQAGMDYYCVISLPNSWQTYEKFQCYISSDVAQESDLGIPEFEIIQPGQTVWYDFEMEDPYLGLSGTTYQLTYENGWTVQKHITRFMNSVSIGDKSLSVDWKYKDSQNTWKPEIRDDNALVYTYGDVVVKEIPIQLSVECDVESISIDKNPFENCYLYEYNTGIRTMKGLTVTIHYKGNKPDQTVVWEDEITSLTVNGYLLNAMIIRNGFAYVLEVTYMGSTDKAEGKFLENPVTGFELKTKPAKSSYYIFEDTGTPDLYGMEFTIQHRDGSAQDIQVLEHISSIPVEGPYGGSINSKFSYENSQDSSGNTQKVRVLYLSYLGYSQKIMEYEALPLPTEDAMELKTEDLKYIVLDDEHPYQVFKVTAEDDNQYSFSASGKINRYLYRYDASGNCMGQTYGTSGNSCRQEWSMAAGETNYLLIRSNETGRIASLECSLNAQTIQKEAVDTIEMSVSNPAAGQSLPAVEPFIITDYKVDSYQWYGDADEDGCADFATAHQLKLVLAPLMGYCFTTDTKIILNGAEINAKTLGSNGKLTLYYTFPYTECKIELPQISGYTIHTDKADNTDRIEYGGTYKFWYTDSNGENITDWIVKANQNPLTADEDGCYTLLNVSKNMNITVKSRDIQAEETESKLLFYNQSEAICDIMIGTKNKTIADNTNGETYLPEFASYTDNSNQFFYGWYTDKDENWNGIKTRFTSRSKLLEDTYDLYAKWGSGSFTMIVDGKEVHYQVLSFDEENRMFVRVTKISAPLAAASDGLESIDALGASENVLEIPQTLEKEEISVGESLGIDIESCTVAALAPNAFEGCDFLDQIVLPETITEIPSNAFYGCQNLTVTLPDTIIEIDPTAFAETENVTIVCSSDLAETEAVLRASSNTEVTVQTVDISLKNGEEQKKFYYGDAPETLSVTVKINGEELKDPILRWQYSDTDAFSYEVQGNTFTVTPKRVTLDAEQIAVSVKEESSRLQASILLSTDKADLSQKDENGAAVYMAEASGTYTYTGDEILPVIVVRKNADQGTVLEETDYEIEYSDNKNAGTAAYQIFGKGNYTGNISGTFTIEKAVQSITAKDLMKHSGNVAFSIGAKTNGDGKLSYASSNPAVADIDTYGIVRIYSVGVTTIGITAEETSNYKASETKYITLTVQPLQSTSVKKDETEKNGLRVYQTAYTRAYKSKAFRLNASADSKITYKSSNTKVAVVDKEGRVSVKNCGKAIITISTNKASQKVTIQVVPKQAKAKVSSKKSGELKVSWTKQSEAAGYVVEYSTDKNFKKNVSKKVITKNKTTSVTIKKLSKGKKYYVRVKAYTKISKKKAYGAASKTVSQKIKK